MEKECKRNRLAVNSLITGMLSVMLSLIGTSLYSQGYNKLLREGNREYKKGEFDQSEINYRQAVAEDENPAKAIFNLGDALYKMERYEEAAEQFSRFTELGGTDKQIAGSNYNLGNTLLKAGKIEESIEAYKRSLLSDPGNHQAKYNLAKAKEMLQQQQQDQQQQQNDDQQQQQNDDQQQQQNDDQQQQQNDDQQQQQNDDQQQQQPRPDQMKPEDAERLLQALSDKEKEVQEKVKEEKARAARVRTLKNW